MERGRCSIRVVGWHSRSMKSAAYLGGAVGIVLLAGLTACGVPGIPKPPSLELPQPVNDLRALRKGDRVYLAWSVPTKTTDLLTIRRPGVTQICRNTSPAMSVCGTPVGQAAAIQPAAAHAKEPAASKPPPKPQGTYEDALPTSLLSADPSAQVSYAVSMLNRNGRSAGLSNIVSVPAAPAPAPPSDFQAQPTEEGVTLSWTGNAHTGTPELRHTYRVYRRDAATGSDAVVADMPFGTLRTYLVLDHTFQWEKTYLYRATVVTTIHLEGKPDKQFEGADTSPIRVFAHDVFPPAVPSGLQAVFSGVGQQPFIDLSWAPDTDADLAGYNIYRREEGGESRRVNGEPVKASAFRDSNVASGHTYFYSVSAVDARGNESVRSDEQSEKVP